MPASVSPVVLHFDYFGYYIIIIIYYFGCVFAFIPRLCHLLACLCCFTSTSCAASLPPSPSSTPSQSIRTVGQPICVHVSALFVGRSFFSGL